MNAIISGWKIFYIPVVAAKRTKTTGADATATTLNYNHNYY